MIIGTDVNLWTCRAEGYLMMKYNKNKLFKKGILNKDCPVNFKETYGYLSHDDNGKYLGFKTDFPALKLNVSLTFNDLLEIFQRYEKEISSFADYENCKPNLENPSEWDMLNLASDINSYYGLE